MGRVCYVPSLLWAEFVMCRVDPTPFIRFRDFRAKTSRPIFRPSHLTVGHLVAFFGTSRPIFYKWGLIH